MPITINKILYLQRIGPLYVYFIFQLSTLNIVGDNIHALLLKATQHTFKFVPQHNLRERGVAKETVIERWSRLPEMVRFSPCLFWGFLFFCLHNIFFYYLFYVDTNFLFTNLQIVL